MIRLQPLIDQLTGLRDHAPPELDLGADVDPLEASNAARFYAAVHAALPVLTAALSVFDAASRRDELDIVQFRRMRQIMRAILSWNTRAPGQAAELADTLEAAVAAWHVRHDDVDV